MDRWKVQTTKKIKALEVVDNSLRNDLELMSSVCRQKVVEMENYLQRLNDIEKKYSSLPKLIEILAHEGGKQITAFRERIEALERIPTPNDNKTEEPKQKSKACCKEFLDTAKHLTDDHHCHFSLLPRKAKHSYEMSVDDHSILVKYCPTCGSRLE
jgi:hypothetical protein